MGLVGAVLGAARSARADVPWPQAVTASWSAPPACPAEAAVRAAVASLLRDDAGEDVRSPLSFNGSVVPIDQGFRLEVHTRSAAGSETKQVIAEQCVTLADAFAVIVAFAVNPRFSTGETSPPAAGPAPARRAPAPDPSPSAPLDAPLPLRFAVGASAGAGVGQVPFPGWSVGALIALGEAPRWELAGAIWPARERAPAGGSLGVRVSLLTVRPSACFPLTFARWLGLCGSVEVGRLQGTGVGPNAYAESRSSWWLGVGGGVAVDVPVAGRAHIRTRLDLAVPLLRPAFVVDPAAAGRELWKPGAVTLELSFTPEVALFSTEPSATGHDR